MSTIVQMPVRVKPPPADMGEIISPGWAFFEVTMPVKGARMIVSSICWCQMATCFSATITSACCCSNSGLESQNSGLGVIVIGLRGNLVLHQPGLALQLLVRFPNAHPVSASALVAETNCASVKCRLVLMFVSSSAREDLPLLYLHPFFHEHFDHLAGDSWTKRWPARLAVT